MIIRSQNKEVVTNFEQITNIILSEEEENKIDLLAMFPGGIRDIRLGTYSTEEKAIKVLDMIQIAYEEANSVCNMSGFVANTVFQMPKDEEV